MKDLFHLIICGGRHYDDYKSFEYAVDNFLEDNNLSYSDIEIVSGHCDGTDKMGERFAKEHGCNLKVFPADWLQFGKAAGPIRNKQMLDYISQFKDKAVLGFTSENSKGTVNTLNQASKMNIRNERINYNINESDAELFEGISIKDGDVEFDWFNDSSDDVIKLCNTEVHVTRFNKLLKYYGYKIIKSTSKNDRHEVLSYIKDSNSPNVIEMIDRMIESFYEKSDVKHYDYIVKLQSHSNVNSLICDRIVDRFDDAKIITTSKKPIMDLDIDWNKLRDNFKGNYFDELKNYLTGIITYEKHKYNDFYISHISPKYRRYLKPMIYLNSDDVIKDMNSNILLVDDTFTTGSTLYMTIDTLIRAGFTGNIAILTLLNNN